MGSGCGSVGRAVASKTRGLRFESSHWQTFINIEHLYTVNLYLKDENKEKEAGNGPFFFKFLMTSAAVIINSLSFFIRTLHGETKDEISAL